MAIDPGVHTGAVWFQVRPRLDGQGHQVNVFADYFAEGLSAETNAQEIREKTRELCGVGVGRQRVSMDPAGNARTAVGPTVRGEYERAGVQGPQRARIVAGGQKGRRTSAYRGPAPIGRSNGQPHDPSPLPAPDHGASQCYARARQSNQWMDYAWIPSTRMKT